MSPKNLPFAYPVIAALLVSGQARSDLIDFEDLTLGTRYFDNEMFMSAGVTMTVSDVGGHIDVQDRGDAGGTGNELEFFGGGGGGGISLDFDFGTDLDELSLLYGAYGGDLNLSINGETVHVGSFADLPATLGGVDIAMTGGRFGLGTLSFDGIIESFAIGGQEFVLDDVVFQTVPVPGALGILGLGLVTAGRRRRGAV